MYSILVWTGQKFAVTTHQMLNNIANYDKSKEVQQANMFKRQTLLFHFSTYCPNSFKHVYRFYQQVPQCVVQKNDASAARSFLFSNTFSTLSNFLTPNMYWWHRKTLVTIHRMHLRVNGICGDPVCPQSQKTNDRTSFLTGCFYKQRSSLMSTNDDVAENPQRRYSASNSLQNVYFGFFVLRKLKERHDTVCNLFMERPSY